MGPLGSFGQPCYSNDSCETGLVCLSQRETPQVGPSMRASICLYETDGIRVLSVDELQPVICKHEAPGQYMHCEYKHDK